MEEKLRKISIEIGNLLIINIFDYYVQKLRKYIATVTV
jgi:hypothetical protein